MANPSYITNQVSMAHCPMYMKPGQYSEVPGDSILGLYGQDFYDFQNKKTCDTENTCTYCEKHKLANLYIGRYHLQSPQTKPITYATSYVGKEQVYRRPPYEGILRVPCNQKISTISKCM